MDRSPARNALLALHRALVEFERRAYEKAHGRVASGAFLQALVHEPAFAWLAGLTSLIARFDVLGDGPDAAAQRRTWQARARSLLAGRGKGDFGARYAERIELSPDVAYAHAAAVHALASARP